MLKWIKEDVWPAAVASAKWAFDKITSAERDHREELTTILLKQYENYSISSETEFNIKSLALNDTLAIATGQQAGISGGPLYTLYKTITAIKLAEKKKKEHPEYNFVPVFWMEIDDHDFNEIASINLLGQKNDIVKLVYNDGKEEGINRGSVSKLKLTDEIDSFINSISENLRDTEYKNDIVKLLSFTYTDGKRIADAFKELLIYFFDRYGLVIIDQHVAHERVLFEEAKKALEGQGFPSQTVLFPQTVKFQPEEYDSLVEITHYLDKIGFRFREFGENTIIIEGIPPDINWGNETQIIREIIDQYISVKKMEPSFIDQIAAIYSCKSAIKAGDSLKAEERIHLIDRLFSTDHPYYCPHGRPIIINLSIDELDQRFERI